MIPLAEQMRRAPSAEARKVLADNIARLARLEAVAQAFTERHIPLLCFKGISLLGEEYELFSERPMRDIDLLVKPADAGPARTALMALGATPHAQEAGPRRGDDYHEVFEFTGEGGGPASIVELHTSVCPTSWYAVDVGALFADAVPHAVPNLATAGARRPSPAARVVIAALHKLKHGYMHDRGDFKDVERVIATAAPNPLKVAKLARRWSVDKAVGLFLAVMRRLPDCPPLAAAFADTVLAALPRGAESLTLAARMFVPSAEGSLWRWYPPSNRARVLLLYSLCAPSPRHIPRVVGQFAWWRLQQKLTRAT
jgi:hypothetical protein